MAKKRKSKERQDDVSERILRDLHETFKAMGWTIPESQGDIRQAETELSKSHIALPEALSDVKAVFERGLGRANTDLRPLAFLPNTEITENLARAARQGGKIPPHIEERMSRDRSAAERKPDENENGEDIG